MDRCIYAPDADLKALAHRYRQLYPQDTFFCRALEAWAGEGEACDEVLLYPGINANKIIDFWKDKSPQWDGKPVKLSVITDRHKVQPPKAPRREGLRPEQMREVSAIVPDALPQVVELPNDMKVAVINYITAACYSNSLSREQWNAIDDEQRVALVLQEIHKQWPEWQLPEPVKPNKAKLVGQKPPAKAKKKAKAKA